METRPNQNKEFPEAQTNEEFDDSEDFECQICEDSDYGIGMMTKIKTEESSCDCGREHGESR